jgi:type IV secretory pathway TrbD component
VILTKVSRRPRLVGAERRLAMVAFLAAIVTYLVTGLNGFAGMVVAVIGIGIALKITSSNEDTFYELIATRRFRRSRSATGEAGSWYG